MMARRRLSQTELSRRSGVPQPVISTIITGKAINPSVMTCYRLAMALRCTVDDLIIDEEPNDRTA